MKKFGNLMMANKICSLNSKEQRRDCYHLYDIIQQHLMILTLFGKYTLFKLQVFNSWLIKLKHSNTFVFCSQKEKNLTYLFNNKYKKI